MKTNSEVDQKTTKTDYNLNIKEITHTTFRITRITYNNEQEERLNVHSYEEKTTSHRGRQLTSTINSSQTKSSKTTAESYERIRNKSIYV